MDVNHEAALYRRPLRGSTVAKRRRLQSFGMLVPLVITLLIRWADGQLSATDVQALAESAKLSGLHDAEVTWLSNTGTCGLHSHNCHRDIMNRYCADMDMPNPLRVKVPCYASSDRKLLIQADVDFLPPHLLAHHLNTGYPEHATRLFGLDRTEQFWRAQDRRNPKFHEHPMLDTSNWTKECSPYVLHADGASYAQRDSLKILSVKPLLRRASDDEEESCEIHIYVVAFPTSCEAPGTWPALWKWVHWSMEAWLVGKHPSEGPLGEELPADLAHLAGKSCPRASLWGFTADLDYYQKDMGMPANNSTSFCWCCECNRSNKPWNDFRSDCAFAKHLRTPHQVAHYSDHSCFCKKVGLTPLMLELDVMHCCEFGVTGHLIANTICSEVYDARPGDAEGKFNDLWLAIKQEFGEQQLSNPLSRLRLRQFCDPAHPFSEYAKFSGIKAAEMRSLLHALTECVKDESPEGLSREAWRQDHAMRVHRRECLTGMKNFYSVISDGGLLLSPDDAQRAHDNGMAYLRHYAQLARTAMEHGRFQWSVVNKFHFFWHILHKCRQYRENPKTYWCYTGEDFVGRISALAHTCAPGTPTHQITKSLVAKYLLGMHLRLKILH